TAFYLAIPYEGAYLLPALPSVLLLLGRLLDRPALVAVVLVLVLECFVTLEPREGRERVSQGRLFSELSTRRADLDSTAALAALDRGDRFPPHEQGFPGNHDERRRGPDLLGERRDPGEKDERVRGHLVRRLPAQQANPVGLVVRIQRQVLPPVFRVAKIVK